MASTGVAAPRETCCVEGRGALDTVTGLYKGREAAVMVVLSFGAQPYKTPRTKLALAQFKRMQVQVQRAGTNTREC